VLAQWNALRAVQVECRVWSEEGGTYCCRCHSLWGFQALITLGLFWSRVSMWPRDEGGAYLSPLYEVIMGHGDTVDVAMRYLFVGE
jgi:hypothetical protein